MVSKALEFQVGGVAGKVVFKGALYAYRARVTQQAAKGSTKLLSKFTKSTIDDATAYAMRTQNNIDHIFDAKHKLGPLVNKLGGQRNAINAALNAGNGRFPASGVFRMQVNLGSQNVWIQGAVHNGMPKLGTMWIP